MAKEVVITNSTLNYYGSRVLTSGIDLTQYQRNPILLWMHTRAFSGRKDDVLPLGQIENLRMDGDDLIGTPVFDQNDEFARLIAAKWDSGILKMVSASIDIIELSEDPALLLPGQTRMTITRSKLTEVSIVDIGANDDAIVLCRDGARLNLAGGEDCGIPFLKLNKPKESEMKTIALKLGLPETATEAEILAAVGNLQLSAAKAVTLEKELGTLSLANITAIVARARREKRITEDTEEHFINLGKVVGCEALEKTLEMMEPAIKPMDVIHRTGNSTGTPSEFKKLSEVPADQMMELRKDRPAYIRLFRAEYGFEPVMED